MLDQLAAAFDRQDYRTAATLLKQFQQQQPDSPWVKLYGAKLREVAGKLTQAAALYRQLLQESTHPKIMAQARQGVQRVNERIKAEQEPQKAQQIAVDRAAKDAGTPNAVNPGEGFLILDAVAPECRQAAAQQFAQIMSLDAYTARLLLPSRGWRLYRVGPMTELQVYQRALNQAEIPAFCVARATIEAIRVFRVQYIEAVSPQITVVCENEAGQLGSLGFGWGEIRRRIEGRLPVFEDVVDRNARNQLTRKEKTQDYAQVIDLHLPRRGVILRLGDWSYQFQQGVVFDASQDGELSVAQSTSRIRWNQLVAFLDEQLASVPVWAEFSQFAETALDPLGLVSLKSHIDLFRKASSKWDQAFQLYSGLVFQQDRS